MYFVPVSISDRRILDSNAKKVEADLYQMANSRPEYYHLVVAKIYEVQKKLEEMRKKRLRENYFTYLLQGRVIH